MFHCFSTGIADLHRRLSPTTPPSHTPRISIVRVHGVQIPGEGKHFDEYSTPLTLQFDSGDLPNDLSIQISHWCCTHADCATKASTSGNTASCRSHFYSSLNFEVTQKPWTLTPFSHLRMLLFGRRQRRLPRSRRRSHEERRHPQLLRSLEHHHCRKPLHPQSFHYMAARPSVDQPCTLHRPVAPCTFLARVR